MGLIYEATFSPEAWVNDYAIPVDPEGDTKWDCTAMVEANASYFAMVFGDRDSLGGYIDRDDVLKSDPAAPEWVREWCGPFTIRVREI